jgi:hypothetical protein
MNNYKMAKPELYFSKYCKHSTKILTEINKSGVNDKFIFISIDKRFNKNNTIYILNPDGSSFPLPPMINRVPVLLLKPNYEILSGDQIIDYLKPQSKNIQQEMTLLNNEPNPFSLNLDMANSFGVSSDNYSFLDTSPEDLSAKGNGGIRQMYNYSALDQQDIIKTPLENDKSVKLNMTLEQIEQQRKMEELKK